MILNFEVKAGCHAALLDLMRRHATACPTGEGTLERFDVLQVIDVEGRPASARHILAEVFTGRAARGASGETAPWGDRAGIGPAHP